MNNVINLFEFRKDIDKHICQYSDRKNNKFNELLLLFYCMIVEFNYTYIAGAGSVAFFDFDRRPDHESKVEAYCGRFSASRVTIVKKIFHKYMISNIIKSALIIFRERDLINDLSKNYSIFTVIMFVLKFAKFFELGIKVAKVIPFNDLMSLNFQTSIGFTLGVKLIKPSSRVISIQHGFITSSRIGEVEDTFSDAYVCWNENYRNLISDKYHTDCEIIVDGISDFIYASHITPSSSDVSRISKAVYFSSFSPYSNIDDILNEMQLIDKLALDLSRFKIELYIRLHPSIKNDPLSWIDFKFKQKNIVVEQSSSKSLNEVISNYDLFFTSNSTAILESIKKGKYCVVLPYPRINILNLSFQVYSPGDNPLESLSVFIEEYSIDVSDLEFAYGILTRNIEKYLDNN